MESQWSGVLLGYAIVAIAILVTWLFVTRRLPSSGPWTPILGGVVAVFWPGLPVFVIAIVIYRWMKRGRRRAGRTRP